MPNKINIAYPWNAISAIVISIVLLGGAVLAGVAEAQSAEQPVKQASC